MAEMTLIEACRTVRIARGITQAELAKRARISRTQLCRIELGQSGRWPTSLGAMYRALGFIDGTALLREAATCAHLPRRRSGSPKHRP